MLLYKDYGMSWDEVAQRDLGLAAYNYLHKGNNGYLLMFDRIYGVGFELPLVYLEKLFNLKDDRDIFLFRHLAYSVFFSFGCFMFFQLNLKLFKNTFIALLPALILVCTPRIFGHAFFNSKDIPFLSMYLICFYVLHRYIAKSNWRNLLLLAFCGGMLVNFRILGVLFIALTAGAMLVLTIRRTTLLQLLHPFIFICVAALVLYVSWPYLWHRPFENFRAAFVMMSKFSLHTEMLFKGGIIFPGDHTMNYLFTWILYSIPVLYLVMSILGIGLFLVKNIRYPFKFLTHQQSLMGWLFILNFSMPIFAVFYFGSYLYDDWRQLYFVWPFMLVFCEYFVDYIRQHNRSVAKAILGISFVYIAFVGGNMYKLHPYEHVYFNELISKDDHYLQQNFEGDYWGVSYYSGLSFLLKYEKNEKIHLVKPSYPLIRNIMMIPAKERDRFVLHDELMEPSYYLTTLRADPKDTIGNGYFKEVVYEIKRQNSVILRIWKR